MALLTMIGLLNPAAYLSLQVESISAYSMFSDIPVEKGSFSRDEFDSVQLAYRMVGTNTI